MSFLNGGFVTKYFSNTMLSAFTISSSILIVFSQIPTLLGIKIYDEDIRFELVDVIIGIGKQIHKTNWQTSVISIISLIVLYIVKRFINEKYKSKLIVPIPIELIVVIIATLISYFCDFKKNYQVSVVGTIPLGMPTPRLPPIHKVFSTLIGDAINIAIVSFALNISLVKYFSNKHEYEVNSNQELFSYGIGNLIISLFSGFPACSGLTRSLIVEGTGARTQIYSLISSMIVLAAFMGVGFLMKELPNAVLASIIVVSLIHKCLEARSVIKIFKKSKLEAIGWCATFCGVIILDIDSGLYIGLGCSLLLIIWQTQRPPVCVLGNLKNTELYFDIKYYKEANELNGLKIIRYEANVYYANVEDFAYKIMKLSTLRPNEVIALINAKKKKLDNLKRKKSNGIETMMKSIENEIDTMLNDLTIKDIVLDLSGCNYIDSMGSEAILRLNQMFKKLRVQLHLSHIKSIFYLE